MAEVTEDEGPDRALGEDLFPGHFGAFPLQRAGNKSTMEHTQMGPHPSVASVKRRRQCCVELQGA